MGPGGVGETRRAAPLVGPTSDGVGGEEKGGEFLVKKLFWEVWLCGVRDGGS